MTQPHPDIAGRLGQISNQLDGLGKAHSKRFDALQASIHEIVKSNDQRIAALEARLSALEAGDKALTSKVLKVTGASGAVSATLVIAAVEMLKRWGA